MFPPYRKRSGISGGELKVESEQLQQNKEYLKKLLRKQRGEMRSREVEVDNAKKITERALENERYQGVFRLTELQDRNKAQLVGETKESEKKLLSLKKNLDDTKLKLSNEEENLKLRNSERIQNINDAHSLKARDIFESKQDEIKDINFTVNEKIKDIRNKTNQSLTKIRHQNRVKIDKEEYETSLKASQMQDGQSLALKRMEDYYLLRSKQQQREHQTKLNEQQLKNTTEFKIKKRIHKDKSEATKRHYNELIKSEKSAFEEKYKNIVADHKKILERLKNIFKKEYNQTVSKYSEKHKASESRNHDKFYTLSTIEPQLREDKNFYYIDIKTPPHEKDNYQVSAYDRKVKVLFNRRSEERLEEGQEVVTSNKSEVITREFAVKDIVNDRNLTQSYQKGVLSYRLPKA